VWWTCVKKTCKGVNPGLCDLAIMLICLLSSSASIERIFSNFGAIQTKLRERLGLEKAAKFVSCYHELCGGAELVCLNTFVIVLCSILLFVYLIII